MSPDEILLEAEEKMIKTEQVVGHEFAGVRTGKASASLIEYTLSPGGTITRHWPPWTWSAGASGEGTAG